ncbi:unnamed protein product [Candida verbasci]|uniref:Methyltransferase OMS1, mitochondrial n=1 Tax=Candida verbasci TaxID=1227364 RepID=A0A9W4U029_9ASCO|nr:unnamed protein product [Candida verbasci]
MIIRSTVYHRIPYRIPYRYVRLYSSSSSNPFPINDNNKRGKSNNNNNNNNKLSNWQKFINYTQSSKFEDKTMPKLYLSAIILALVPFYFYMRDRYYEDKQLKIMYKKKEENASSLTEYEYLALKSFNKNDKLKPLELKKYKLYQLMRKEFRRQNLFNSDAMFNPSPKDLDDWYSKQARKSSAPEKPSQLSLENDIKYLENEHNPKIQKSEDTTNFYDLKAKEYDDAVKWEERGIFMGSKRKWLMSHAKGDVLEISCGTGRNIPYFYPQQVKSITFIDSARNMVQICKDKFENSYPNFKKVAYAVGKGEDLTKLSSSNMKYDTIIEAFGLCCHKNPVQVLKNMSQLLKPGGRIVLLEHGRSNWEFINNHLDFRSEKRMAKWKCRWNLDIGELIDEAGLDIVKEKRAHLSTTWMMILKKPGDPINSDEKPFLDKLFGRDVNR